MKKLITIDEADFNELQRKAELHERSIATVSFRFSGFTLYEELKVSKYNFDASLLDEVDMHHVDSIIQSIKAKHDYIVGITNQNRTIHFDNPIMRENRRLKSKLERIPNWIKRLFYAK